MDVYGVYQSRPSLTFFLFFLLFFIKINSSWMNFSCSFFSFAFRWEYNNEIKYTPETRAHTHTHNTQFSLCPFSYYIRNVSFLYNFFSLLSFFIISYSNEALRTRFMLFFLLFFFSVCLNVSKNTDAHTHSPVANDGSIPRKHKTREVEK